MPRRSHPTASPTLAAAVRQHFGLSQAELAAFVGVSQQALAAVEAGHKTLGPDQRLQVLARQLPPPAFDGDEAADAPITDPDEQAALAQRLARCRWLRTQLLYETSQQRQPGQARHLRRLWAVRVLGPALAQPLPVPDWRASYAHHLRTGRARHGQRGLRRQACRAAKEAKQKRKQLLKHSNRVGRSNYESRQPCVMSGLKRGCL